jgi:hypothetical protein
MKNKIIYILLIIGLLGTGNLVLGEIYQTGTCPKLGSIPACYLVFLCFLIPLIVHYLSNLSHGVTLSDTVTKSDKYVLPKRIYNILYYLFTGFALALATYASIGQLLGKIQCPKTDFGLPMCYISFVIFLSLILLKIVMLITILKKRILNKNY